MDEEWSVVEVVLGRKECAIKISAVSCVTVTKHDIPTTRRPRMDSEDDIP